MSQDELLALFQAEVRERLDELSEQIHAPAEVWDIAGLCRITHSIKGAARIVDASSVAEAAHALEDVVVAVRDGRERAQDVIEVARERCEHLHDAIEHHSPASAAPAPPVASPAPPDNGRHDSAVDVGPGAGLPRLSPDAEVGQEDRGAGGPGTKTARAFDTLRVSVVKLDRLMGLASELVMSVFNGGDRQEIAETLVDALADLGRAQPSLRSLPLYRRALLEAAALRRELLDDLRRSERLSEAMQDAVRALRMVPVGRLRAVSGRAVREACLRTGRQAELAVSGEHTEIDRVVLEGLIDPVVHLLRNAVAHGIESPEERLARGKCPCGCVALKASVIGAWVELSVTDDGRGIDLDLLRDTAIRRHFVDAKTVSSMSTEQLCRLLFEPGFTTAAEVDELAGRGVGLDVVERSVTALGGGVTVESAPGQGTCFRLRVPLTRLTTRGIIVRLGEHFLCATTTDVERAVLVERDQITEADGVDVIFIDGRPVPAARLESVLRVNGGNRSRRPALVFAVGDARQAFLVDEVIGQRELIVQQLGSRLRHLPGISGVTVLEGGRVAFVLDCAALARWRGERIGRENANASAGLRRRRVLVADDSVTSRTLLKNILTAGGYEVVLAQDGGQAWKELTSAELDLLVSDIEMPLLDGFELTRRVRADPRLRRLPVLLVTSLGKPEHRRLGADAGANEYVVKGNFDQERLLAAVARLT